MCVHICACLLNCFSLVCLFATLWTKTHRDLLSMRFSRQEYWSGLLYPPPGDLPKPEVQSASFTTPELAGKFLITRAAWEVPVCVCVCVCVCVYIYIYISSFFIFHELLLACTSFLIPTLRCRIHTSASCFFVLTYQNILEIVPNHIYT